MKTYGRRFINSQMKGIAEHSLEIKNGVIWSVDSTTLRCNVKILGTTDIIVASFPPSFQKLPNWIQQGAPVYLRDRLGYRNALEIVGPGHVLPAPTTGTTDDYSPTQPATNLPDRIMTGCAITEIPLEAQMKIMVHTGSVRIDGSTIAISSIKMDSTTFKMDMGGRINDVAAVINITAATTDANDMRYDLISADTAGILTYHVGTTFPRTNTTETITTISDWEIEIGRILVPPNTTIIKDYLINRDWASAVPNDLKITMSSTVLVSTITTASIEVEVVDQYNNTFAKGARSGWRLELGRATGATAKMFLSSSEGTSTVLIGANCGATSAGATFTYTKPSTFPQSTANICPILTARLIDPPLEKNISITNWDTAGVPITSANN